ncbi:MAG: hypothetical protein HY917_05520, partial [Candidatus Diapherotrites archaeon]|nr:hypothetical protein [Candidatus Diapherotrites archaeon]
QIMRVPDLLIGLTLGAIGPSIPNMAAAWQAVRRGNDELAISETIGSNIFTLLITLGLVAIVQPLKLDASVAQITIPAVVLITGLFLFFSLKGRISRKEGFILFGAYLTILIFELLLRTG